MVASRRTIAALCAALLASVACAKGDKGDTGPAGTKGDTGPTGPAGAAGSNGQDGQNGVSTGTLSGILQWQAPNATSPSPVAAATVVTIPATVTATTSDLGEYKLENVPVGVYSLKFTATGYSALQVDNVAVLAGKNITVPNKILTATNPLVVTAPAATAPAGFDATVNLAVTVSGGTAPYTYAWTPKAANPTAVTLSSTTAAAPTFKTGTLSAVLASGKVTGFGTFTATALAQKPDTRAQFLGVSTQQLAQMSYAFDVTVTDAKGFAKTATVTVPPATLAQGSDLVPTGQIVIANLPGNTAAATLAGPVGSTATLNEASSANPWFIPDLKGRYTLTAGTKTLIADAGPFVGSAPDCGGCHTAGNKAPAKFVDWANSAHGNHFFKYMHYDSTGKLVWNTDASGKPIPAPTANPGVFWTAPGAMTTFEFGMKGGEGTHYSSSCTGCHTTGNNGLASNGGFDDVARIGSWSMPSLAAAFPVLTGPTSGTVVIDGKVVTQTYDQVTAAPVTTAFDAMPASVKAMAGMQCESCHGPLGGHLTVSSPRPIPGRELGVESCAVCHDRPANHDRVALWRNSAHANMDTVLAEGSANGSPRTSCNRCHSGQGALQYMKQLAGEVTKADGSTLPSYWGDLVDPATGVAYTTADLKTKLGITVDNVQAITCAVCHDPHTTGVRFEGTTPMLPSGFKVKGAGTGAVCMVCHNSRNGSRSDALNGVYYSSDLPNATKATAIGGPHEANQTDVYVGLNAFFVSGPRKNGHLSVANTCVGCHMENFPAGMSGTNTNHTFKIDNTSCAKCHGEAVDGEGLQAEFESAVTDLQANLVTYAKNAVVGAYYKGSASTLQIPSDATITLTTGRSLGITVTFAAPVPNPDAATGTITALTNVGQTKFYTDSSVTTPVFDPLKGVLAKANWNYSLLEQDGSKSVHNPGFAFDVINATNAALANSSLAK